MWNTGGHGWGWVGMGVVQMFLFWGLIILAVVALVRYLSNLSKPDTGNIEKTPKEILNERLARGEIDREEFEERKRLLIK